MRPEPSFTLADVLAFEAKTGFSVFEFAKELAHRDPLVIGAGYRLATKEQENPFELEVRYAAEGGEPEGFLPGFMQTLPVCVRRSGKIAPLARTDVLKRPIRGGACIGVAPAGEMGTLACRAHRYVNGVREDYLLSNAHVLDVDGDGANPTAVQPGVAADLTWQGNEIGTFTRSVPLNFSGGANRVDAAMARASAGMVKTGVMGVGAITSWRRSTDIPVGLEVLRSGINSPVVCRGVVSRLAVAARWNIRGQELWFEHVIATTDIAKRGDSGSLLIAVSDRSALGLVMAADDHETMCCPIEEVQAALGVVVSDTMWTP